MVPYLSANQGVTTAKVAEVFGTTPRQVIRDLEVLQFCGLPGGMYDDLFDVDIEGVREDGHIFFRNADVLSRPLRLRPAEAASLIAALQLVADVAGETDAASSALAKLTDAFGDEGARLSVTVAATDPQQRAALTAAINARSAVELTYRTPGRPGTSQAIVEPARLRLVDGFTYLDAWSRPRDAWRSYRLDRIESVEVVDDPVTDRGDPPSGWFGEADARLTLTVRPRARWIAEYYPTLAVDDVEEGLRVTFPLASQAWAAGLVLRLGDDVVEVSDPEIATVVRRRAAAALALYEPSNGVG
jgi:proteasome accessory factor C